MEELKQYLKEKNIDDLTLDLCKKIVAENKSDGPEKKLFPIIRTVRTVTDYCSSVCQMRSLKKSTNALKNRTQKASATISEKVLYRV